MGIATLTPPDEGVRIARTKLAHRLAALEDRVAGTIGETTDAVRETTASVRATARDLTGDVRSAVETASQRVQEALDFRKHLRTHPWESTLAVVAAGVVAGIASRRVATAMAHPAGNLMDVLRREVVSLGETAIAAASKSIKANVEAIAADAWDRLSLNHSSSSA